MRAVVALVLLGAACGAPDPCTGIAVTCLALHIDPSSVREVHQLDFDIQYGSDHGTASSRAPAGRTIVLPAATAIALGAATSSTTPLPLRVRISGVFGDDVVGRAELALTVARDEHASARVALGPLSNDGGAPDFGDGGCQIGGFYCGGDKLEGDPNTLYRCAATGPVIRGACVASCEVRPGRDDRCRAAGGPCTVNGRYCGGDELPGDPQTLYRCDGTENPPVVMVCANGCAIQTGDDDFCR
jgi:hypothetical protein